MLGNRSFDHMLGFLYPGKSGPNGQPFEGLLGTESNNGADGKPVTVFQIDPTAPEAYFIPGAEPTRHTVRPASRCETLRLSQANS
jgi:phospholipase C